MRRSRSVTGHLAVMLLSCIVAAVMLQASPASAQTELADGPKTLVIQYRTDARKRPAFRQYLIENQAPRLRALKARGVLSDFRIFYSWYTQPGVWDAMIELRFPSVDAVAQWNVLERKQPGGLDAAGLDLATPVLTASSDLAFSAADDTVRVGAVYYIIPYQFSGAEEYREYVKGYVLPQFDGWRREGSLAGYQILLNRYPVGRPWDSLVILEYRDMAAFGRRQAVLDKVRVGLADAPAWQAFHERKGEIRSETENSIAELIAH